MSFRFRVRGRVADPDSAALAPVDRSVISLAAKIVQRATSVSEQDIVDLRDCGLSDEEIFDVILTVAARCFFSKALDATGTAPDSAFAQLAGPLRDALTVGRPIAVAQQQTQPGPMSYA
jgi:alkylhydroperoxidase family enzyme